MTDTFGPTVPSTEDERLQRLKTLTLVVYGLQAASFLGGIPPLVGIVVNNVKLDDVRGTWLESHFRWQIRTFWFGLLWAAIGVLTLPLFLLGYPVLVAAGVWLIYRIVKGGLNLMDGKEMYGPPHVPPPPPPG